MTGKPPERLILHRHATPIGAMLLACDDVGHLRALEFADCEVRLHALARRQYRRDIPLEEGMAPESVRNAIDAYFAGDLRALDQIPCRTGGTAFQRKVWSALRRIPPGRTVSYGALAQEIGLPRAVRAVGAANGANPISVVVPCHRVIGSDGTLTGYGGGLPRKQWLLRHEGAAVAAESR